jgi:hypothetical protein
VRRWKSKVTLLIKVQGSGSKFPGSQNIPVTEFCIMAPNILGSSARYLPRVVFLVAAVLRWLIVFFWKTFGLLA